MFFNFFYIPSMAKSISIDDCEKHILCFYIILFENWFQAFNTPRDIWCFSGKLIHSDLMISSMHESETTFIFFHEFCCLKIWILFFCLHGQENTIFLFCPRMLLQHVKSILKDIHILLIVWYNEWIHKWLWWHKTNFFVLYSHLFGFILFNKFACTHVRY